MKKVLIVAYHFPPDSQVGGIRPAKFAKYLPEYGWEAHILTIKDKYYESIDTSRLKELGAVAVTRTSIFITLMDIILFIKRLFQRSPNKTESLNNSGHSKDVSNLEQGSDSFIKRILNSLLESPDKQVGWLIPAVWAGLKIIRKEKIDVILTTAPPATVSMVGLALAYLSGKKLVTDLRDPLYLHTAKAASHKTWLSIKIEQWLENKLYQRSAMVTSATDRHTNLFKQMYSQYPDKFHTVWNGFDSTDFKDLASKTTANKKFTINYIGSFYDTRNPDYFLQALHHLIANKTIKETDIQVNFIGAVEHTLDGATKDIVAKNQLEHCVNIQGQIPYKEALNKMREADVLLLLAPADMNFYSVPAKTFEYIYANNNILCLTSDSATGDFIKNVECGKIADFFSVKEIAQCLEEFYTEWTNNKLKTENTKIKMFERKQQTRVLASLLATL